jgi:hypothetical protein
MKTFIALTLVTMLAACSGGGSSSTSTSGFSQTYTASAPAGEILTYTFDSINKTYSYTITESSYGLGNSTGSGTLTLNTDGSYSPSESPTSKVYALQNGLLVGRVKLLLGGTYKEIPILGVANPATTGADMAGTYNFISLQCTAKNYGIFTGCNTYYGSVQVVATGALTATYTTCVQSNITNGTGGCSSSTTGSLTHKSGGVWEMVRTGSANKNFMVAFVAPNNQKVGLLDFNDLGGYGYGQAVAAQQIANVIGDVAGTYIAHSTTGGAGTVELSTNYTTSSGYTITPDTPWLGMAKTSSTGGNGYGILAGTGVYVYRDPNISSGYFEVGMRK